MNLRRKRSAPWELSPSSAIVVLAPAWRSTLAGCKPIQGRDDPLAARRRLDDQEADARSGRASVATEGQPCSRMASGARVARSCRRCVGETGSGGDDAGGVVGRGERAPSNARSSDARRSSRARRMTATISSTVGGSAGSACPCCVADARRGSRASSPASGDDPQNQVLTSWSWQTNRYGGQFCRCSTRFASRRESYDRAAVALTARRERARRAPPDESPAYSEKQTSATSLVVVVRRASRVSTWTAVASRRKSNRLIRTSSVACSRSRGLAAELCSADLSHDRPSSGVPRVGVVARIGLDDDLMEGVARDRGPRLVDGARNDHRHVRGQ